MKSKTQQAVKAYLDAKAKGEPITFYRAAKMFGIRQEGVSRAVRKLERRPRFFTVSDMLLALEYGFLARGRKLSLEEAKNCFTQSDWIREE